MNGNIQKSTMYTEAVFSKDYKHRYLIHKVWEKILPKATIILLYPGYSNEVVCDTTTALCVNQASTLGFGSIDIVNIFSLIGIKNYEGDSKSFTDKSNDEYIINCAKEADQVILATGRGNNKSVKERTEQVVKLLEPFEAKLFCISDKEGNAGFHPLSPRIRYGWKLVSYQDAIKAENGK